MRLTSHKFVPFILQLLSGRPIECGGLTFINFSIGLINRLVRKFAILVLYFIMKGILIKVRYSVSKVQGRGPTHLNSARVSRRFCLQTMPFQTLIQ